MLKRFQSILLAVFTVPMIHSSAVSQVTGPSYQSWTANPELVAQLSNKQPDFNYDEAKVPSFELPNPLKLVSGEIVTDAQSWNQTRRPELMELFRQHVYGRRPDTKYAFSAEQLSQTEMFDGAALGCQMKATITIDDRSFSFPFVVFIPTKIESPVPAVVFINNRSFVSIEDAATYDSFYPVKDIIDRGYATASFFTSDADPDRADGYADGIRGFFADGQPPSDDAWRSLSAWGFTASRILDHLQTIPQINATKVAIAGHSRGGKASLWAAAEDQRFAIAYSNHSGCGGAALSRRAFGETVGRITSAFPHWFCPSFASYAGRENDLPVDQHELFALLAPRGVYVSSADEDLWADPKGEYLSLVDSAPVFSLLGKHAIGEDLVNDVSLRSYVKPPPLNRPQIVGQTGYHIGSGGHGLTHVDWRHFLDFADGLLK